MRESNTSTIFNDCMNIGKSGNDLIAHNFFKEKYKKYHRKMLCLLYIYYILLYPHCVRRALYPLVVEVV
jgi:hypothetical protein